jgi:hypothetical protein
MPRKHEVISELSFLAHPAWALLFLALAACGAFEPLSPVERERHRARGDTDGPAGGDAEQPPAGGDTDVPPGGDTTPVDPCANGGCAECTSPGDCAGTVDNSTGCWLVDCVSGSCEATLRHDGGEWRIDPILGPEIEIADAAAPEKVVWDGEAFAVLVRQDNGRSIVRVDRVGNRVGTSIALPVDTGDVAWDAVESRWLIVINVPHGGEAEMAHIDLQFLARDGAPLGPPATVMYDGYNDIGRSRVAVGPLGWIVVAQRGTTGTANWYGRWGGGSQIPLGLSQEWPYRVLNPNVAAHGNNFVIAANDQHWWVDCPDDQCANGACPEIWGMLVNGANGMAGSSWSQLVNITRDMPCDTANNLPTVASGTHGFILGSGGGNDAAGSWGSAQVRVVNDPWQPSTTTGFTEATRPPFRQPVPVGFDGANYLVVPETNAAEVLYAYRFTEGGVRLDTAPLELTPRDAIWESDPQLDGDRAGRWLFAYRKSHDAATYVRLFSTCP